MSDQHASRAFRKSAPRGTVHRGPAFRESLQRSDLRALAALVAEGKASRTIKRLLKKFSGSGQIIKPGADRPISKEE